jgi:hypothetical protein
MVGERPMRSREPNDTGASWNGCLDQGETRKGDVVAGGLEELGEKIHGVRRAINNERS